MNAFIVPTLGSRVEELYAARLEKLRSAIVQGIKTIPFVKNGSDDARIEFKIQMYIPTDLWVVLQDLFSKKDWCLSKDTRVNYTDRENDINNIFIGHMRVC